MRIEKIEKSEDLKRSKRVRERERENLMRSICGENWESEEEEVDI